MFRAFCFVAQACFLESFEYMDDNYFVVPRRARLPILAWDGPI